ncbi:hypothetical protein FAZ19_15820 [Sphingobacterium alkalisoli]|uniref:RHS repeat-associated core domain-containing protein n=1 Tax=Sphingobacterium alkalisoli TaxID=1874115 RepID=A0A4U0GX85_9SPHI|nr:RHS repeat-associated core domain-containing protein [Sphingobacterium alkalisoli]TJY63737.1 hypothetical protein FAZ19_15820 [Sphingobacterium alkalisoli]GGH25204.1 hypothetical protein GCM10011418_33660 [Sphingobacterium alkalisoli]
MSNSTQIDVNSSGCLNCGDVFFDQLRVTFTRGKLKEEAHYYPFGLPIAGMGSAAPDMEPNRYKYQGNEHNTQLGLHWMNFNARQYDPQIGRFLGVDPLAAMQGQEHWSPYAAMGNNPAMLVDPWGLSPQLSKGNTQIDDHVGSGAALMARILSLYGGGSFGMGYQHSGALGTASSWGGMSAHSASVYHRHIAGMQWATIIGELASTGSYKRGGGDGGSLTPSNEADIPEGSKLVSSSEDGAVFETVNGYLAVGPPSGDDSGGPWVAAGASIAVLTADDITGIGVVDDIAIPVIAATAVTYDVTQRFYLTYTLIGPGGQRYSGRTSGFGDPYSIMMFRYNSHHMRALGYGSPSVDVYKQGLDGYPAIRGREQQLIDFSGGVGNPKVGNSIRGVGRYNPLGRGYHNLSNSYFGPLSPYTGY